MPSSIANTGKLWKKTRPIPRSSSKRSRRLAGSLLSFQRSMAAAGLSLSEASVILEEINRAGANSGACHAQMYIMGTLLRHGSEEQKRRYLPDIASGALRLQSFAVTEPTTGTDTTKIKTFAARRGDHYVVNGQKVWISRIQHSDLMLLLARTTPVPEVKRKTEGLSVFLVDLREADPERYDLPPHSQPCES